LRKKIRELNRLGRFCITRRFLENNIQTSMKIMGKMIVVKAELDYATDSIQYTAYSPMFKELRSGEVMPKYLIAIEDGEILAEVKNDDGRIR